MNPYITNMLLFLSIITPEQTSEVHVQLILGFSKKVSAQFFMGHYHYSYCFEQAPLYPLNLCGAGSIQFTCDPPLGHGMYFTLKLP